MKVQDSRDKSIEYYKSSIGEYSKVANFAKQCKSTTFLYQYARSGKINIDVALYLTKVELIDDRVLLDLISKHGLNSKQSRDLSSIKNDEECIDLFEKIKSETDGRRVKQLIKYYIFRDYNEIFSDLMTGKIEFKEAQSRKTRIENELDDSGIINELPSPDNEIDRTVFLKLTNLAKRSNLTVNQFLTQIIEKFENSSEGNHL
jgi:hypothetical protein